VIEAFAPIGAMAAPIALGVFCGALIHISGVGAGVVLVPALTLLLGLPPATAVGTASAFSTAIKIPSAWSHWRSGSVSVQALSNFASTALPLAAIAAGAIATTLRLWPEMGPQLQAILRWAIAIAAVMAAASLLVPLLQSMLERSGMPVGSGLCGLLVGSTGVGGGALIVPLLMAATTLNPRQVVGTSIAAGLVLSAVAALIFGAGSAVDWSTCGLMLIGAVCALKPAEIAFARLEDRDVRALTIGLVCAAAVAMLTSAVIS
jgi:hypothetical protein